MGPYVVATVLVMLQVPGSLGIRTVTGLDAFAILAVYVHLEMSLSFRFQCQSAPSSQPESDLSPLPDSRRGDPLERGHWVGWPLDGEVDGQAQGMRMPWAENDWLTAEECTETLSAASHCGVGKQMNQKPSLNSDVVVGLHRDSHWLTVSSAAW